MSDYMLMIAGSDIDNFYEVEAFPSAGDVGIARPMGQKVGGCVLNVAVVARSYGSNVKVLDYLEKDSQDTELFIRTLNEHNVDTSEIMYGEGVVNGSCLILSNGNEKCIYVIEPQHPKYEKTEKMQNLLNNASYIYSLMHTIKLSFEDLEMLREAKRHGAKIIFDGASQYNDPEEISMLMELSDGLFINKTCYERLKEKSGYADLNDRLFKRGCEFICVTDGSRKSYCYTPDETYEHDSFKVSVVDSTGAGDSFAGCFLSSRDKGYPFDKCLKLACASGAYACLHEGGMAGAFNEEGLLEFIRKQEI